ncbi:MAG TPA: type II secretion system protein GspM [Stellaceae bacterium]
MTSSLSPRAGRALALAILAGLVLFVLLGVVVPLLDAYDQARSSAERNQAAIEHIRQSARSLAELQAELARLKEQQASAVGFMQSSNSSLAAAELQNRIKSSVETARGELRSTQILPARDERAFRRISIRGQIAVNTAALQRLFYELESASPFLFLDNIEIHARPPRRGAGAEDDPMLEVRFDLYGYMRRAT